MTDKERLDLFDELRPRIQTDWQYDKGHIVRIDGYEGTGETFREAFDVAFRIREIRRSRW